MKLFFYPLRSYTISDIFIEDYDLIENTEVFVGSGKVSRAYKGGEDVFKVGDSYFRVGNYFNEDIISFDKEYARIKIVYSKSTVKDGVVTEYKIVDCE